MTYTLPPLRNFLSHTFDDIIDVRSPGEFAEDHLPGSINLPVLNDEERARVGTIYKQDSAFQARKIGGVLVARRAAINIEMHLLDKPGSYRPLVYCWRGGMRSGAFATILKQIGWRAETLEGGYRAFRRAVIELLYAPPTDDPRLAHRIVLLDGNTGTGKTDLLARMAARGAQVIDLEGLARHRGSLFGGLPGGQPAQKAFDTAIAVQWVKFDPGRPVLIEAESSRIGKLAVPRVLWALMRRAPRIRIEARLGQRGTYLAQTYGEIASDPERLSRTIDLLKPYHSAERLQAWHGLAASGQMEQLACELIVHHYDPKYARQRAREARPELGRIPLDGFGEAALDAAAGEVMRLAGD